MYSRALATRRASPDRRGIRDWLGWEGSPCLQQRKSFRVSAPQQCSGARTFLQSARGCRPAAVVPPGPEAVAMPQWTILPSLSIPTALPHLALPRNLLRSVRIISQAGVSVLVAKPKSDSFRARRVLDRNSPTRARRHARTRTERERERERESERARETLAWLRHDPKLLRRSFHIAFNMSCWFVCFTVACGQWA